MIGTCLPKTGTQTTFRQGVHHLLGLLLVMTSLFGDSAAQARELMYPLEELGCENI